MPGSLLIVEPSIILVVDSRSIEPSVELGIHHKFIKKTFNVIFSKQSWENRMQNLFLGALLPDELQALAS